jgi:phosphoglycolate phosphatase
VATIQCGAVRFTDVQAVIFDKDGTLADSFGYLWQLAQRRANQIESLVPGVQESLLRAFGAMGKSLDPAGLMAVGTRADNETVAAGILAAQGLGWMEAKQLARSQFRAVEKTLPRKADLTPPLQGAIALLTHLADRNIPMAIVSADSTQQTQDFVDRYGLNSLVKRAIGSDLGIAKPDPALLHQACDALGVAAQATLVVGDSAADVVMAQKGGAAGSVVITWSGRHSIQPMFADSVIQRLDEIFVIETSKTPQ